MSPAIPDKVEIMKTYDHRFKFFWALILVIFSMFLPSSAMAKSPPKAESGSRPQQLSVWETDVGGGFRKNAKNIGFTAGTGFGLEIFGSKQAHQLALAYGHMGWMATDVISKNRWYQGNLEIWGEVFGGAQNYPESAGVIGLTIGPRYYFVTHGRWVPFIDAGAGVSGTDIGEPDLGTGFQFNVQLGGGTHYFFKDNFALTFQIRGIHMSNGYIKRPNHGANAVLFLIGATYFF
ncbi:MAG: acyloxyacyl hydrolase [Desulfobacterales bacterium]|jgi:lipid A 3-O-deacylase|nr:acyloxyacyl hydrolase [Desulfobacterales bacterium]